MKEVKEEEEEEGEVEDEELRSKAANLTGRYSSRYKGRHVKYSLVALCSI